FQRGPESFGAGRDQQKIVRIGIILRQRLHQLFGGREVQKPVFAILLRTLIGGNVLRLFPLRARADLEDQAHAACAVPPTVNPSMRKVGWPTPTGTLWPFFPQTPMPVSSFMSLPIIFTRCIASGPLPISVAPLIAGPILPFSIR